MEIPRHVIFASYWLSLKSSQSSIEATEYVEGNVSEIYFSFGNGFSFFFLPAMLLCAGRTFPPDWTMCDLNACYRGSWWKIVLATAGFPFIMHFFTEGSMFQKLGLRTRINFSLSKGVIPLKNSHEEVEIEAGFQRFNKKFAEKNVWDYKF